MAAFATSRRINTAATCAAATVNSGGGTVAADGKITIGDGGFTATFVNESTTAAEVIWVSLDGTNEAFRLIPGVTPHLTPSVMTTAVYAKSLSGTPVLGIIIENRRPEV